MFWASLCTLTNILNISGFSTFQNEGEGYDGAIFLDSSKIECTTDPCSVGVGLKIKVFMINVLGLFSTQIPLDSLFFKTLLSKHMSISNIFGSSTSQMQMFTDRCLALPFWSFQNTPAERSMFSVGVGLNSRCYHVCSGALSLSLYISQISLDSLDYLLSKA